MKFKNQSWVLIPLVCLFLSGFAFAGADPNEPSDGKRKRDSFEETRARRVGRVVPATYEDACILKNSARPRDQVGARAIFERLVQQDHLEAHTDLALMLIHGIGGSPDLHRGTLLLEVAIGRQHVQAKIERAKMLWKGPENERNEADERRAKALFEQAMNAGSLEAKTEYAVMLYYGGGGRKNVIGAFLRLEEAAEQGDPGAKAFLAMTYRKGHNPENGSVRDYQRARVLLEEAVAVEHEGAKIALAKMLYNGQGGEASDDISRARGLIEELAQKGNPHAMMLLATIIYFFGETEDYLLQATNLAEKAEAQGFWKAKWLLASLLYKREDLASDERAKRLLEEGVAKGHTKAKVLLAKVLWGGVGVERDYRRAKDLLRSLGPNKKEAHRLLERFESIHGDPTQAENATPEELEKWDSFLDILEDYRSQITDENYKRAFELLKTLKEFHEWNAEFCLEIFGCVADEKLNVGQSQNNPNVYIHTSASTKIEDAAPSFYQIVNLVFEALEKNDDDRNICFFQGSAFAGTTPCLEARVNQLHDGYFQPMSAEKIVFQALQELFSKKPETKFDTAVKSTFKRLKGVVGADGVAISRDFIEKRLEELAIVSRDEGAADSIVNP